MAAGDSNTAVLSFGQNTESWNGTNWTNENDLNVSRGEGGGAGTQTAALAFGGTDPSPALTTATEEWNGTGFITRTITSTTE
jgi:hypothetical protein